AEGGGPGVVRLAGGGGGRCGRPAARLARRRRPPGPPRRRRPAHPLRGRGGLPGPVGDSMVAGGVRADVPPGGRRTVRGYHLGTLDGAAPSVHPDAWIAPGVMLVGRVTVGWAASIWYGSVLRADDDQIVVGLECNIQDQCCLHVDEGESVILDERVSLGH